MTPRTAKRRVRWDTTETLVIDGYRRGEIQHHGDGAYNWETTRGDSGLCFSPLSARRALLRACAEKKEKRR